MRLALLYIHIKQRLLPTWCFPYKLVLLNNSGAAFTRYDSAMVEKKKINKIIKSKSTKSLIQHHLEVVHLKQQNKNNSLAS